MKYPKTATKKGISDKKTVSASRKTKTQKTAISGEKPKKKNAAETETTGRKTVKKKSAIAAEEPKTTSAKASGKTTQKKPAESSRGKTGNIKTKKGRPVEQPAVPSEEAKTEEIPEFTETEPASKSDTMKMYMREIDQYSLISKEQEVDLAAKMHCPDLAEREAARNAMIIANLRLVVKIAHDFKGWGLQLQDLISEGNIGLMRAVDKFDPSKGAKFSSYAAWWIKQSMRRALLNQGKIIRVPVQSANKITKIRNARVQLTEKLGREPSYAEIARELNLSERTVAALSLAELHTISLQDPIQQGESDEFQDIIPDRGSHTPDQILGNTESVRRLIELLDELDERERLILEMRFGLGGRRPRTLEGVSQTIGRTRERVRQIQNQALNTLREKLQDEAGSVQ